MKNIFVKIFQFLIITVWIFVIKGENNAPEEYLQTGTIIEKHALYETFIMKWTSGHTKGNNKVYVTNETFSKYKIGQTVSFKRKGNFNTYYNLPTESILYGLIAFLVVMGSIFMFILEIGSLMDVVNKERDYYGIISCVCSFLFIDLKKLT